MKEFAKAMLRVADPVIPRGNKLKRWSGSRQKLFTSDVAVCQDCGYGKLVRIPSKEEVFDYYTSGYWTERDYTTKTHDPEDFKKSGRAKSQYEFVLNALSAARMPREILEIGAGDALPLQYIRAQSPDTHLAVCEPGEEWNAYYTERRIERIASYFPFETDRVFDYIHTSHWLEHIADLDETFDCIRRMLKPGGSLFIEVPNTGNSYWEHPRIFAPHMHFFTMDSLPRLLAKHDFATKAVGEFGMTFPELYAGKVKYHYEPKKEGMYLRGLFQRTH